MHNVWGFDIETNQLSPFKGEPAILSAVLYKPEETRGYLLDHPMDYATTDDQLSYRVDDLYDVLSDPTATIVGHNLVLFDVVWWEQLTGLRVRAKLFDTRVAQALIDENAPNSLAALVWDNLGRHVDDGMKEMRARLEEVEPATVLKYNVEDSRDSFELHTPLLTTLSHLGQEELFETFMVEYRTLADMTLAGMLVDEDYVKRSVARLAIEEVELKQKLLEATGVEFNPDSPPQVAKILFEDLRFPVVQTTKTGQPSTSAPALRELRQTMVGYKPGRDLLDNLVRYREVKKMAGTYLLPYLGKHRGNDGRIHPTIYIGRGYDGGTRTGRLAMSNPNLQNVPRDATVKGSFVPTDGYKLFDADYAQVELRVAAFLAEEDGMLSSFADGLDIHTATLAEIEGLPYLGVKEKVESGDKNWKRKRAEIKAVNFLILYGGGPYQLVTTLRDMGQKVSLSRAEDTIDRWFKRYWRIAEWIEKSRHQIIKDGGAVNIFGQVRHLPGAGLDSYEGQKALRQGVNFLVQSVAAKFALMSLPFLQERLSSVGGRLLLTVHDSIVGEYPSNIDPEIVRHMIDQALTTESLAHGAEVFGLDLTKLPLAADTKMGLSRWG